MDARPQTFEILGPRFELPEDAIYSVFPENGHAVAHDVLPHIVFNDRMMPWERPARNTAPQKQPDDYDSNRVPWMACLTFTADELQLASAEMSAIFAGTSIATTAKQTDSLNVSVPIAELSKVNSEWAKLPITDDRQATKPNTNLIFPKVALINALFSKYDPPPKGKDPIDELDPTKARLIKRLRDGYIMIRSLTATGEETAALMRSPLTPTCVAPNLMTFSSNSGSKLQILDQKLGMMDMSFSLAWNLGRTLAMADRAYTIALTRVRRQILKLATDEARLGAVRATSRQQLTREELLQSLSGLVDDVVNISRRPNLTVLEDKDRPVQRWSQEPCQAPDLAYYSAGVSYFIETAIETAAYRVASTTDEKPKDWPCNYDPPYDEFNTPYSPDWVVVLRFIMDLYHLVNVPSRYLMVDQSFLPTESLRFFHVDHNWIKALVDGALSLGNQGLPKMMSGQPDEADSDPVRSAMKLAIDRYLTSPNSRKYQPPVSRFGFYLRSEVVAQFPDLKVSVSPVKNDKAAPMLLRHDILDKGTMIGFFSDEPIKQGVQQLIFEVPPHQQYFSIGKHLTASSLEIAYKRQYTVRAPDDTHRDTPVAIVEWKRDNGGKGARTDDQKDNDLQTRSPVFIWGSEAGATDIRLLQVEKLAADVFTTVTMEMKKIHENWLTERRATSATMGIQLNSPAWRLEVSSLEALSRHMAAVGEISPLLSPETNAARKDVSALSVPQVPPKIKSLPLPGLEERARLPGLQRRAVPPYFRGVPHERHCPGHEARDSTATNEKLVETGTPSPPSGTATPSSSWSLVNSPVAAASQPPDHSDEPFEELVLQPLLHRVPSAGTPRFSYCVSPTTDPGAGSIPLTTTRQDLIFSIVYEGLGRDFQLAYFQIKIPVRATKKKNLMDTVPASPGVRMVSNLRFHARMSYSDDDRALYLTLLPRSTAGEGVDMTNWVGKYKNGRLGGGGGKAPKNPLAARTELSVLLSGVHVKDYEEDTDIPVEFYPKYVHDNSDSDTYYAKLRLKQNPDDQCRD